MNTRFSFIEYLKHFEVFANQEHDRRKNEPNRIVKPIHLYNNSRDKLAAARGGQMGELGRVFNEFPAAYVIEEKSEHHESEVIKQSYYAIDPRIQSRWIQTVDKIVTQGSFKMVPHPEAPDERAFDQFAVSGDSEIEIIRLAEEMIGLAAGIILDSKGDLNLEIVRWLEIETLLGIPKINDNQVINANDIGEPSVSPAKSIGRAKRDEIVFQVVYSYISQILIGGISEGVALRHIGEPELVKKVNAIGAYLQKKLMTISEDEVVLDAKSVTFHLQEKLMALRKKKPGVTAFFKNHLLQVLFDKSIYSEEVVAKYLLYTPISEIKRIVKKDLYNLIDQFANFMPAQHETFKSLISEMLIARGDFWIEVMKSLQKQGDILRLNAVMGVMPASRIEKWKNLENSVEISPADSLGLEEYHHVLYEEAQPVVRASSSATSSAAPDPYIEQKEPANESEAEPGELFEEDSQSKQLDKWFYTRDNLFISDYMVHEEIRNLGTNKNKKLVINELTNSKFNRDIIQLPTLKFFEIMFDKSEAQDEFLLIVRKHFPDISAKLELRFHNPDEPLKIAIKNNQWNRVLSLLMSLGNAVPFDIKLMDILTQNAPHLTREFIRYQKDLPDNEKLASLNAIIDRNNTLGVVLATPTPDEFLRILKNEAPQSAALWLRQNENENDLSIGLQVKDWKLVVKGLLALENKPNFSVEDKKIIYDNREKMVEALINYFNKQYAPAERIVHLNEVINGQNALGKILKEPDSMWFSISFSTLRDSQGNRVTPYVAELIENRDTVKAILNSIAQEQRPGMDEK